MRNMSRIWTMLVVGVSLGMTLFGSTPVKAVPLSNTPISWDYFTDFADVDNPVVPPLLTPYEFKLAETPLGDGSVYSQVFLGKGNASGLYVYVYQIQVARAPNVEGISIAFITDPTATPVNGITSFYINQGTPTIGFGLGNYSPASSAWVPISEGGEPTLRFNQINVPPGYVSYIFGTFSPLPPTTIDATLRDATELIVRPLVYTPTPEPSVFILLGVGLGIVVPFVRRRYGV